MRRALIVPICIVSSVLAMSGQTPPEVPSFEVASVKAVAAGGPYPGTLPANVVEQMAFGGGPGTRDPGRIHYSGATLRMLLARAYNMRPDQISGPDWLDTQKYEIIATLPPGTDAEQLRLMLQKLLTERLEIRLHGENKTASVYNLIVAKNGPKLKPAEKLVEYKSDEERTDAMRSQALAALALAAGGRGPSQRFHLGSATTAKFAEILSSSFLDRPVEDKTHLDGLYSFALEWAPDNIKPKLNTGNVGTVNDTPSGPSIFTAVEEQLGLRLQAAKEQIEVLVIDSAEKSPAAN